MPARHPDLIVLGLGVMGAAALDHLARRGASVLGIDQFDVPHDLGSSHGRSRVFRKAYFEDPRYVPLLHRAFQLWRDLEAESAQNLLHLCGGINIGPPDHPCIRGVRDSVAQHHLPHEVLDAPEIRRRFPALRPPDGVIGIHESDAGVLDPERCVRALLDAARRSGASVLTHQCVNAVEWTGTSVSVRTADEILHADRLVVAAGPWLPQLLPAVLPLRVERQVQLWFRPRSPDLFALGRMPVFITFLPDRAYYGIPALDDNGLKVCRHHGGPTVTPETVDRSASRADIDDVLAFARGHLAPLDEPPLAGQVCLYTNAPDDHFIIGPHPDTDRVLILSPCSGHGFKFAPVLGEIAADLALTGRTVHDVSMFSPARFAPR